MLCSKMAASAVAIGAVVLTAGPPAAASEQKYSYRVDMPPYGQIGTYSSLVTKVGVETTIITEARIKVSLVGVALYRQEISRIERQMGTRVVYFRGVTTENGKPVEVTGRAEGEHFVITSPTGSVRAPGTIRAADPWSVGEPGNAVVFMPDTGVMTRVRTTGDEPTAITIDGTPMQVRRLRIETLDGQERYQIWVDDHRTPVMFEITDRDGTVTFTLGK